MAALRREADIYLINRENTQWLIEKSGMPFDYDMVVLFTPSGAKSLVDNYPDFKQGDTIFACFGESTAKKLEELGFRVDIKVAQGQGQSMASTIEDFLIAQKG